MKSLTMRLTIAAAAFVAAAGLASAQTMEAKIPFAFHANGKVLAPGTYRVRMTRGSGIPLLFITDRNTGNRTLATGRGAEDPKAEWVASGSPVLHFECGAGRCTLSELWMGTPGEPVYRIPTPNLGKNEYRIVAEVVMHRVAGD